MICYTSTFEIIQVSATNIIFIAVQPPTRITRVWSLIGIKSDLTKSYKLRRLFVSRFNQEMAVWLKKCYFIKLGGTKEVQECASMLHLEISSMSSGEKPRKSRGTLKEPQRYMRY